MTAAKLVKDSSDLESSIKPFLDAAYTETWKSALRVLYINSSILSLMEEPCVPVLISQRGDDFDTDRMTDLLMGKAKSEIAPLLGSAANIFLPKILAIVKQTQTQRQPQTGDKEETTRVAVVAAMEFTKEMEAQSRVISELLIQGVFSFADLLSGMAFNTLIEKRDQHIEVSYSDEKYEEMIDALFKLGAIQPRLHSSLCPDCANYELAISPGMNRQDQCGRCGADWTTLTLYTFRAQLDKIKAENSDLSLFISSYLRSKLVLSDAVGGIDLHPKAEILTQEGEKVEIDVYIPHLKLGIECKSFEDCFAPMTKSRLDSVTGRLVQQAKRYANAGIEAMIVVTNLHQEETSKVKNAVIETLRKQSMNFRLFEFVDGSVESLIKWLDELTKELSKIIDTALDSRMKQLE